jgi:phosphoglycolate phosphatase
MDSIKRIKIWLGTLSYRSGIIAVIACVVFYVISFTQMLLPISVAAKGALWVIFFGLAKTAQYSAIIILGKAGIESLRKRSFLRNGLKNRDNLS